MTSECSSKSGNKLRALTVIDIGILFETFRVSSVPKFEFSLFFSCVGRERIGILCGLEKLKFPIGVRWNFSGGPIKGIWYCAIELVSIEWVFFDFLSFRPPFQLIWAKLNSFQAHKSQTVVEFY